MTRAEEARRRFALRARGAAPAPPRAAAAPAAARPPDTLTVREAAGIACLARAKSVEEVLDLFWGWLVDYEQCRFLALLAVELVQRHGDENHLREMKRAIERVGQRLLPDLDVLTDNEEGRLVQAALPVALSDEPSSVSVATGRGVIKEVQP